MGEIMDDAKPEAPPKIPPKGVPLEAGNEPEESKAMGRTASPTHSPHQDDRANGTTSIANDPNPLSRRPIRQTYANTEALPATTTSQPPERSSERESRRAESPSLNANQLQTRLSESEQNTKDALIELEREKRDKGELGRQYQELISVTESLQNQVNVLTRQLKETKGELEDTRSHILSMQPYVKDITPEEIGRDFDDLYESVCNWVETWMTPVFDDEEGCREVFNNARKNVLRTATLRNMMNNHPDILRITEFPDTNQDAAIALIMRYLHKEIFSKVLYDIAPDYIQVLQGIEDSMRESVQPKRDLFAVRNWRAESFTSLVNHPAFSSGRDDRCRQMTVQLGKPFLILISSATSHNEFYRSLDTKVIAPAVRLQEKIQSSIHHYWFVLNEYGGLAAERNDLARASELLDEFDQVDCEDVLRNRRRLDAARLHSAGNRNEILHKLYPICTMSPRLMMRQVGQGEIIKEPRVIRKQKTLVAWGTSDTRVARLKQEPPTLMNAIYHIRPSRSNDGGGLWKGWV